MQQYQLAIIGGGMQGAALFWEAVHRGIDTVLIERGDYGSGTSANSLRVVHGGLRHLQRADLRSCLQMIREQRILLQIAPALVRPLPCAMPTTRTGKRSAPVMRTGLWLYDRLREIEAAASRRRVALPASAVERATEPVDTDLRNAITTPLAHWHDAQVLHAERLTLAFVNAGRRLGGSARNHTVVTGCRGSGSSFELTLRGHFDGDTGTLRSQRVIDCSSDWRFHAQLPAPSPRRYVKAVNLLLDRPAPPIARGLYASNEHVNNRLLFLTPWRGRLLVGTWYFATHDRRSDGCAQLTPGELAVCRRDLDSQLAQPLAPREILHAQVGYLPARAGDGSADPADDLLKSGSRFSTGGLDVVEATKFTTVRVLAQRAVDHLAGPLGAIASTSHSTLLTQPFDEQLFSEASLRSYDGLLRGDSDTVSAQVLADADHAIEHEQVGSLADLVRRRLPLGDACPPPAAVSEALLAHLAGRRGWTAQRQQQERVALAAEYPLMEANDE